MVLVVVAGGFGRYPVRSSGYNLGGHNFISAQRSLVAVRAGKARQHQEITSPHNAEKLHLAKVRKQEVQQVVKKAFVSNS